MLNFMDKCNLVDFGMTGGSFRKLDRTLVDVPWRMSFPDAYVEVLGKFHSDHNPLLLQCGLPLHNDGSRPFRFEAAWITNPNYSNIVQTAWGKSIDNFTSCLHNVQQDSLRFHKETFGNIRKRKIQIERRLKVI
ncbi:uncharacterized protein LOC123884274 [Trifolium pratense]|uniref:uncharacterized protein LOC123884274 n=1 Tax=Trifolium pratense TaxID=57577 RepID=UPI001E69252D|nr:uncharacterized protein LOC123884274 [Trifolium pratense]